MFKALKSQLLDSFNKDSKNFSISGLNLDHSLYLLADTCEKLSELKRPIFLIGANSEQCEVIHHRLNANLIPTLEHSPYSGIIQSELNLIKRITQYQKLSHSEGGLYTFTLKSFLQKFPSFKDPFFNGFQLNISDILSPFDFSHKLTEMGYHNTITVEEPGTFSVKGEIFDLFPIGHPPIRIHYFDDMIEEIFLIDTSTYRTDRSKPLETIEILPSPYLVVNSPQYHLNLRANLPSFGPDSKDLFQYKNNLLKDLKQGRFAEDISTFFPLFFNETSSLYKDAKTLNPIIITFDIDSQLDNFSLFVDELLEENHTDSILPKIDYFYEYEFDVKKIWNLNFVEINLEQETQNHFEINFKPFRAYIKNFISPESLDDKYKLIKESFLYLNQFSKSKKIYFNTTNDNAKKELRYLVEKNISDENQKNIIFQSKKLEDGFYYPLEESIHLSENDFFKTKINKVRKKNVRKDTDVFAEQLSTLAQGDFVVHSTHGIGRYLGIDNISIGGDTNDFVVLEYDGQDKVYVPVYKLNLLQKFADNIAGVKLDNLNSKKFQLKKQKAKQSIKKLAFDLLELNAKRELQRGYQYSPIDHDYTEFELDFPFETTQDQQQAIEDVINDMTSVRPMDRLVCGDVGFGKTEVAMRAAFKAVLDHKQVCILVPTTVLAFQHFNSFKERFKNYPVNIELLSRFRTSSESKEIIEKINTGNIDIVIGTHKLLSDKIKYNDLGLVIIDEEHRFGVGHKEKLKCLKENVDVLTMTATPIPRTLQLSFLGIRDFSLIKTPPPNRQSIKSYVIKEDDLTIQKAIRRELSRGGQTYFVHNRVQDIESINHYLKELVPEAKIIVAHGQLSEKELEKKITAFYKREADILLSTTIIESGIDIPTANTMIINKADRFGLAQLHQLRGRIGRSDKKAYAYFLVPATTNISEVASKRLHALKTYADMGSGFSIASTDLEIRGSGDILGAEQSGHIAKIGLELYTELLQETINEIKGRQYKKKIDIEITSPFKSQIPSDYIPHDSERLKIYKKLSNCSSHDGLDLLFDEVKDSYGHPPIDTQNLISILHTRLNLNNLAIKSFKASTHKIHLYFDDEIIKDDSSYQEKIVNFFTQRPKVYKIMPNFSVVCSFKEAVSIETMQQFSKHLKENLLEVDQTS
jgi:transcription-repair coupling factor (superfamily II helicase)